MFAILLSAFSCPNVAISNTLPPPKGLSEEQREIRDAALLSEEKERAVALRMLLEGYLLSDSRQLRTTTFDFVAAFRDEIGIEQFADILIRYDSLEHSVTGQRLLDRCALEDMPIAQKIDLFRDAMLNGSSNYGVDGSLQRITAIRYAVEEGIYELAPTIETSFSRLSDRERQGLTLPYLLTLLELRACEHDGQDSTQLAVDRIRAMDPSRVRDRMNADLAFQRAVSETLKRACERDPFLEQIPPSCVAAQEIIEIQQKYYLFSEALKSGDVPKWMNEISLLMGATH